MDSSSWRALGAAATVDSAGPFATPVAIFMEATPADLEEARKGRSTEDFAVMADDLMYYRSTAYEYLEAHHKPVLRITGRRPLTFIVNGAPRVFDYAKLEHLDVVVIFDGIHEPRAMAPVDVGTVQTLTSTEDEAI